MPRKNKEQLQPFPSQGLLKTLSRFRLVLEFLKGNVKDFLHFWTFQDLRVIQNQRTPATAQFLGSLSYEGSL